MLRTLLGWVPWVTREVRNAGPDVVRLRSVKTWGSREKARDLRSYVTTLYLTCVQEIAKLSLDSDDRAPSVRNFVDALGDESLRSELREHYAVWPIGPTGEHNPDVLRFLEQKERRQLGERRVQFDAHYDELRRLWSSFSVSPKLHLS